MSEQSQQEFIARVRDALADHHEPVELPDDLEIARLLSLEQDPLQIFALRAEEAGMHAYRVADENALVDKIMELIDGMDAKSAIVPQEEMPARQSIIDKLQQKGIEFHDPNNPEAAFDADVGITGVTSAIAETASIILTSGNHHRRLASLAVPNHIAIVRAEQIVPDLLDWAAGQPTDQPASEVLVSGPSKTADIEMILVTGVHGPKEEHIIIIG